MKFYQKLDGSALYSGRDYDIASNADIKAGQVVKLADGLVVAAAAGETGAILGVALESHSGSADSLDPRANGTRIKILDDPNAIFQCKAPEISAASGTATTIVASEGALAAFASDDLKGGYVQLIAKAAESSNTDPIGRTRRISAFSSGTLTVEQGGTASAGDVYAIFPPVGFAKGNLSATRDSLVLSATANLPLRVVGFDLAMGKINLAAKKHLFAVDA